MADLLEEELLFKPVLGKIGSIWMGEPGNLKSKMNKNADFDEVAALELNMFFIQPGSKGRTVPASLVV